MNVLRARLLSWLGVEATPWSIMWVDGPDGSKVARFNDEGAGTPLYVLREEKQR